MSDLINIVFMLKQHKKLSDSSNDEKWMSKNLKGKEQID